MAKGPIKMLYVLGKDFSSYEFAALWNDGAFGIKRRHDFSRVAIVGDPGWAHAAVEMIRPFFRAKCGCSRWLSWMR